MFAYKSATYATRLSALMALSSRSMSSGGVASKGFKVAVLGAAGGIGQPLSLLLKSDPLVKHLSLYDIVNTPGVAADLSHISTPSVVSGHTKDDIENALRGANVVVIPAGVPRKPGMTRDDLFNTNASIVKNLADACARFCPDASLLIIANPVNSTVPICAEVLKKRGVYNPAKLFGVTTLDVTRARTFVAQKKGLNPTTLDVPVIGGHAGTTILPLLSRNSAGITFSDAEHKELTKRIQFGGDEVVAAKDGAGSATLSMAYAGAQFTSRLLEALSGKEGVIECTFVQSNVTDAPFFATPVELGTGGVKKIFPVGKLNPDEAKGLAEMLPTLQEQIEKGIKFANQ